MPGPLWKQNLLKGEKLFMINTLQNEHLKSCHDKKQPALFLLATLARGKGYV